MLLSRSKPKSSMCQSQCFPIQQLLSLRHCRRGKRASGSYIPCSHSPILPSLILLQSFVPITHDLICGKAFLSLLLVCCFQVWTEDSQCHTLSSLLCASVVLSCILPKASDSAGDTTPYWKLVLKWKWVYASLPKASLLLRKEREHSKPMAQFCKDWQEWLPWWVEQYFSVVKWKSIVTF